jgi:hypothetical protein
VTLWSGWAILVAVAIAALLPLVRRALDAKRPPLGSQTLRIHVVVGLTTSALAFAHTLLALPALGSSEAIGAGVGGLLAGALAFCVLVAHAGIGLQLRQPKLRKRESKRRTHVITAIGITLAAAAHVVALRWG